MKKKAIVLIHPTVGCCKDGGAGKLAMPLTTWSSAMFEFLFDTTRAVINLILTGTVSANPDIKWIMAHAGAVLPPLVDRVIVFAEVFHGMKTAREEIYKILRDSFYYDVAGMTFPNQIEGLLKFADKKHILYGTDYPPVPVEEIAKMEVGMDPKNQNVLTGKEMEDVFYNNAQNLFK